MSKKYFVLNNRETKNSNVKSQNYISNVKTNALSKILSSKNGFEI